MDKQNIFIKKVCDMLEIDIPTVEIDLLGGHECAEYFPKEDKIIIIKDGKDAFFEIAHELRHKWQWEKKYDEYMSDYVEMESVDLKNYGKQKAEIDANGFAMIVVPSFIDDIPTFKGYPMSERTEIFKKAKELSDEYNISLPWDKLYAMLWNEIRM